MELEPVPFLANMALVAHADGVLSSTELGQLEAARKELKLKKSDYNAALRLIQDGAYTLTPVGTFADQVKNLELILRVAYADDDLDQAELSLIQQFCQVIGIHEEQLERLRTEVLASLKNQGRVCPSCGTENQDDSKFCSKCGTKLGGGSGDVQVDFELPSSGVAIEFAESTAASFPKALQIAKETDGYQTCQKRNKAWYLAVFPSLTEALPLVECLSRLRNRVLHIDGEEQQWDEVLGFAWCAAQRDAAYRPVEYCFGKDENRLNPWGCKQVGMDWTEWANWFCQGKWEKSGVLGRKAVWRFDKDRLRHELVSNLHRYRFCPHLKRDLAEAVVRHFPDLVEPDSDVNWDYHQSYEEVPGAIKVIQKERTAGFVYQNEFWADGVRPKGLAVLTSVLGKACKDLGMDQGFVRALLK
jgi:uncharacterized tellurite resistance protein B-like protein